ncbi:thaumatin, partial [Cyathus striatus]
ATYPNYTTGWEAPGHTNVSFTVPDDWRAGRIWGRTSCNFSTGNLGLSSCLTGGCNGGLQCATIGGTGLPPATVAEWTLGGANGTDWYDVSVVDGHNLPMIISNNKGCPISGCEIDLNPNCPTSLSGPFDPSSLIAHGCKSSCFANLDGSPSNSSNCCTGTYSTPSMCPPDGVSFYSYFKDNCPRTYAYAYDESSGTALWTCDSSLHADYTLSFCP